MATEEMLKQLLEEFAEKETLVSEEIKVVIDEIAQLEAKIELCKRRLATISGDREKVLAMRDRYINGQFSSSSVTAVLSDIQERVSQPDSSPATQAASPPSISQPSVEPPSQTQTQAQSWPVPQPEVHDQQPPAVIAQEQPPAVIAQEQPPLALPAPSQSNPASPVPSEQAYPPADLAASEESASAQAATPLKELRKRFGLSSLLGNKKTADQKQADVTPPAPWAASPEPQAVDKPINGAITLQGPVFDRAKHEQMIAAKSTPSGSGSGVSPAPPVTPPAKAQHKDQPATEENNQADNTEESDNDTVKSINDALRSLFR